jgi:hypothetical protein
MYANANGINNNNNELNKYINNNHTHNLNPYTHP